MQVGVGDVRFEDSREMYWSPGLSGHIVMVEDEPNKHSSGSFITLPNAIGRYQRLSYAVQKSSTWCKV